MNHVRPRPGSALIEVIVAISIAALIIPPIFGLIQYAGRLSANAKMRTRAVTHAKAALEAVIAEKNLRWNEVYNNTKPACNPFFYPRTTMSGEWELEPLGSSWKNLGNGFEGRLCLIEVLRNSADNKLGSGALDTNIIQVMSKVQWDGGGTGKSVQLITHITNWHAPSP